MNNGPETVPAARFDYANAINRSQKEQTLLTLVKMRYMDPPMLLDVSQVIATYGFVRTGNLSSGLALGKGATTGTVGASVEGTWSESPTITYSPLTGDRFANRFMRPIQPTYLLSLVQSGWPVEMVFGVGVKTINGLRARSGLAMLRRAGDPKYYRALSLMQQLQETGDFALRLHERSGKEVLTIVITPKGLDSATAAASREVRQLLGLDATASEFEILAGGIAMTPTDISLQTRTMFEIFGEFAAGVDVPAADVDEGRATKPLPADSDKAGRTSPALRVHSSAEAPSAGEAFAAVQYRGSWFWISDRDLSSKRELTFLMILLSLAEEGQSAPLPIVTISK